MTERHILLFLFVLSHEKKTEDLIVVDSDDDDDDMLFIYEFEQYMHNCWR